MLWPPKRSPDVVKDTLGLKTLLVENCWSIVMLAFSPLLGYFVQVLYKSGNSLEKCAMWVSGMRRVTRALPSVAQLVGAFSHEPKGGRFDSQSGHMPRLWFQSLVSEHMGGHWLMFLSHINVSLPISLHLSPPLSLSSPLSKINEHVLGWRF